MWYYSLQGKEVGPVPLEAVRELIADGVLTETDPVRSGHGAWLPIREIPELSEDEPRAGSADLDALLGSESPSAATANPVADEMATEADLDLMLDDGSTASEHDLDLMLVDETSELTDQLAGMLTEETPAEHPRERRVARWYCKVLNQELGPFDFDALSEMVAADEIGPSDQLRQESEQAWVRADTVVGLFTDKVRPTLTETDRSAGVLSPQRAAMFAAAPKRPDQLKWFSKVLGQEFGPVSWKQLQAEVRAGKLSGHDEIRAENSQDWSLIANAPELVKLLPQSTQASNPPERPAAPPQTAASPPAAPTTTPPASAASPPRPTPSVPPPSFAPPASTSRPGPPPAPPRPAKSTSSSGPKVSLDLSGLMSSLNVDPKILGGIAAAAIVIPLIFYFGLLGSSDQPYIDEVKVLQERIAQLNPEDDGAWTSLTQELAPLCKTKEAELLEVASSQRPALRTVLDIYRYTLPRMGEAKTADERTTAVKQLQEMITAAEKLL
ncbi:MAG: DUF4339 domain-containing protein [Planctomycetaceae bacterium]|nr:DUF4339 domain-containing protein [Planctomycetaceae bacterium]